jgi:hypothetical protein
MFNKEKWENLMENLEFKLEIKRLRIENCR